MRLIILLFCFICGHLNTSAQSVSSKSLSYEIAFKKLGNLIVNNQIGDFKKAVFICENVFYDDTLNEDKFNRFIDYSKTIIETWSKFNTIQNYRQTDSASFKNNFAIYHFLKDTTKIIWNKEEYYHLPYTYDFDDFFGREDWSNMFVSKLIASHTGNCHSLPYLYKILADDLGASCWLSFAPNHIYIKNRCLKVGWYNTELTSGEFPIDAWIATSGYVPVDAIRNGIYMDTLSNQQAIAQCFLDLAKEYEFQDKNYNDGFIIKCCDLTLQYHPLNVQAILMKAETLKHQYDLEKDKTQAAATYAAMEKLYIQLLDLGFREMPDKMYLQWLKSVTIQQNKYGNKNLKEVLGK